jgi:hypothetical protein
MMVALTAGGVTYDILDYVNTERFEAAIVEELLPAGRSGHLLNTSRLYNLVLCTFRIHLGVCT